MRAKNLFLCVQRPLQGLNLKAMTQIVKADETCLFSQLEWTINVNFFIRKESERRIMTFKRETSQIVWFKPMVNQDVHEGASKWTL